MVRERGSACPEARITVKGKPLNIVDSFIYLGSLETAWNSMDEEITRRVVKMRTSFAKLAGRVFMNPHLPIATRLRTFDMTVVPIALYGCTCWHLSRQEYNKRGIF